MRQPQFEEREEERVRRPAAPTPHAPQLARIIALQQSAGNQAVGRLLSRFSDSDAETKEDKKKLAELKKKYAANFGLGGLYEQSPMYEDWDYFADPATSLADLERRLDAGIKKASDYANRPVPQQQPQPQPQQPTIPLPNANKPKTTEPSQPKPKKEKQFKPLDLTEVEAANPWTQMQHPDTIHQVDVNATMPAQIMPPLTVQFNRDDYTSPIASWSPNKHAGTSGLSLSLANVQAIVTWLQTGYARRNKVFLRRGEGSGTYTGAMQLKIIHKTEKATGSTKKATYHLSLRPEVYQALNTVEYANADWDGS